MKLHAYQEHAVEYIKSHNIAAVFLSMGLGKTIIALTAINDLIYDSFDVRKVLVICPIRVCLTWKDEINKWEHLRHLKYSVCTGTARERLAALRTPADIYIINRENVQWLVDNFPFDFDMVVIDELSSFKNHKSKRFKALMKVRPKVKRIVGLTGTPAPNGLSDLWAEFRILDMGESLGRFITRFHQQYFTPDRYSGNIVYSYKPLPGAEEQIYEAISDKTISMTAEDYLDMPEYISSVFPVEMSKQEMAVYIKMKKELCTSLGGETLTAANAAALSGKLLQMANGAVYAEDGSVVDFHSRKLDALEDILEAANGHPVLLVYWFKHDLHRITERLRQTGVQYECISTEASIARWNAGKTQVGLIHPAAAGHGLNLQQGGNIIVWYGLTWSLELYQQTNARLYRQGQKSDRVIVQHIITKGSIDEQVVKALAQKDTTQQALIDAVKLILR